MELTTKGMELPVSIEEKNGIAHFPALSILATNKDKKSTGTDKLDSNLPLATAKTLLLAKTLGK